ncbi:uncharacterized protein BHQ10_010223 [Talaromyces amestolkiae]|uniref:Uncharacterized protein n=1 Tax=Talaromyces amestolkiae TaxID=1196081 RepID=A0A364LES2_TALAM|nr:uncharacterized protein BHQ10_010223 [Talaromyces amestolkiae]RAO74211.1 hypothetical protein BHQ10_010223 [Talaromyces amestolkiae]
MSQFCCLGSKPEPRTQIPAYPEAGFMPRPETQMAMHMHHQPPQYDSVNNGYSPVVPLPRYTPRPMSIHEKTLETNNIRQSHGQGQHRPDEKNRQDFEDSENDAALHANNNNGRRIIRVLFPQQFWAYLHRNEGYPAAAIFVVRIIVLCALKSVVGEESSAEREFIQLSTQYWQHLRGCATSFSTSTSDDCGAADGACADVPSSSTSLSIGVDKHPSTVDVTL